MNPGLPAEKTAQKQITTQWGECSTGVCVYARSLRREDGVGDSARAGHGERGFGGWGE